jgi:hypothetical protein
MTTLDSRQKDIAGFYGKVKAHDILLRMVVWECQRRNPKFVAWVRWGLDIALGTVRAKTYPEDVDPFELEIDVQMRETVRAILDVAENADAEMRRAVAALTSAKPLTFRRRILNWFERG